jgi:hypothetical protein
MTAARRQEAARSTTKQPALSPRISARTKNLAAQCRRLEAQVRQLESERDQYRQALYAYLRREVRSEDWHDFRPEDFPVSAAQILDLIEQLNKS